MENPKIIMECAEMFEKYYDRMSYPNNREELHSLDKDDMQKWKDFYFEELKKCPDIQDYTFFEPETGEKNENTGVGRDGIFSVFEYCNIRYQLYKHLVKKMFGFIDVQLPVIGEVPVVDFISMLESYVPQFAHKGVSDTHLASFVPEHRKMWDAFYELNEKMHLISDGEFFGNTSANPNYGIGKDGAFFGVELLHFLGNCYKYIWDKLTQTIGGKFYA